MSLYLIQSIDRIPPKLCRLLARKRRGTRLMTCNDIAAASGLSRDSVIDISKRSSWRGMNIDVIQKFSIACGVNLVGNQKHHIQFVQRGVRSVMKLATVQQRGMLDRIMGDLGIKH